MVYTYIQAEPLVRAFGGCVSHKGPSMKYPQLYTAFFLILRSPRMPYSMHSNTSSTTRVVFWLPVFGLGDPAATPHLLLMVTYDGGAY